MVNTSTWNTAAPSREFLSLLWRFMWFSLGKRALGFSLDQEVETGMWVCALCVRVSLPKWPLPQKAAMLTPKLTPLCASADRGMCCWSVAPQKKPRLPSNSTPFCHQRGDHNHGGEEPEAKGKGFSCTFSFGSFPFPLPAGGADSGAGLCLQD